MIIAACHDVPFKTSDDNIRVYPEDAKVPTDLLKIQSHDMSVNDFTPTSHNPQTAPENCSL